jgi:hypothetical protein
MDEDESPGSKSNKGKGVIEENMDVIEFYEK